MESYEIPILVFVCLAFFAVEDHTKFALYRVVQNHKHDRYSIFVWLERIKQLFPETFGDRVTADTVSFRPAITGHVKRSEDHIDYGEMNRKVLIDRFFLNAVMPVVKTRGRDDVL